MRAQFLSQALNVAVAVERDCESSPRALKVLQNRKSAMYVLRLPLLISVLAFTAMGQEGCPEQRPAAPASCAVTRAPAIEFTPPGEHKMDTNDHSFWLGTDR